MILLFKVPVFSASSHFGTLEHRFSSGPSWLLLNASVSFSRHKQPTSRVLPLNKLSSLAVWVLKKISEHIQSSWKQNWFLPDNPECTPYKKYADRELSQDSLEAFSRQNSRDGSFLKENQGSVYRVRQACVVVLLSFPGSAGNFLLLRGFLLSGGKWERQIIWSDSKSEVSNRRHQWVGLFLIMI